MAFSLAAKLASSIPKRSQAARHGFSKSLVQRHRMTTMPQAHLLNQQQIRSVYSINKITLLGHAGGEPQTHQFSDGTAVTSFSLAVSESYTSKKTGEKVDRTDWFRVSVYPQALQELTTKMVQKGSRVYVEGNLRPRKWTDQQGQEHLSNEVLIRNKGEVVVVNRAADESGNAPPPVEPL